MWKKIHGFEKILTIFLKFMEMVSSWRLWTTNVFRFFLLSTVDTTQKISALFNFFFCTAQCHLDISASLCVFWILSLFSPGIHSSQLFHFRPPPTHHHNSHNIFRENKLTTDGNSSSSLKIEIAIILVKVGAGGNKFSFF